MWCYIMCRFLLMASVLVQWTLLSFLPAMAQGERTALSDSIRQSVRKYPQIEFEHREHDFGCFSATGADTLKQHAFTFKNTGEAPLVIQHVATGCGCTTPTYSKEPVLPGEQGQIIVAYRGENQLPGFFRKSVTVYVNDPRRYIRIFIKGELIP